MSSLIQARGVRVGALLLRLHEATKSARRQESCTRPTTSHEATKPGTSTDSAKISPHTKNRRREPRRRPTTSYEARKSASTAGASHDTTCPPNTPRRGTHASRRPVSHSNPTAHTELKPDRAHRKLRGQGLSDLPPQSEPAERRRKANTKPARSQQKLARRQISRSALRQASRPRSRSR